MNQTYDDANTITLSEEFGVVEGAFNANGIVVSVSLASHSPMPTNNGLASVQYHEVVKRTHGRIESAQPQKPEPLFDALS